MNNQNKPDDVEAMTEFKFNYADVRLSVALIKDGDDTCLRLRGDREPTAGEALITHIINDLAWPLVEELTKAHARIAELEEIVGPVMSRAEFIEENGEAVLACDKHGWIGSEECLYCREERLRAAIEAAPHLDDCNIGFYGGAGGDCNCWKAAALKEPDDE